MSENTVFKSSNFKVRTLQEKINFFHEHLSDFRIMIFLYELSLTQKRRAAWICFRLVTLSFILLYSVVMKSFLI